MIWSKLKKTVEVLMAEAVKEHLHIHLTRYGSGDTYSMTRAWITWDGEEINTFSTIQWLNLRRSLAFQISGTSDPDLPYVHLHVPYEYFEQASTLLSQQGVYPCERFLAALETYTSLPIDHALNSSDCLVRAWSMFDRRLGKRRLRTMRFEPSDFPPVQSWYQLRCDAEKIVVATL